MSQPTDSVKIEAMKAKLKKEGMSKTVWLKEIKDSSLAFWGQYPSPPVQVMPVPVEGR